MKPALPLDLAALAADPGCVAYVAPAEAPRLYGEAQALAARLWQRLQAASVPLTPPGNASGEDRLLTVQQAAAILGTDRRWVYRHADTLPFTRRLSPRALRFSERALRRWIESRGR